MKASGARDAALRHLFLLNTTFSPQPHAVREVLNSTVKAVRFTATRGSVFVKNSFFFNNSF